MFLLRDTGLGLFWGHVKVLKLFLEDDKLSIVLLVHVELSLPFTFRLRKIDTLKSVFFSQEKR